MTIPAVPMQLLTSNDETSADLYIMGNVSRGGWFGKRSSDTDANDVAQALMDLPKTVTQITVHINSFGGEVAEGIGIYNALRSHPAEVTTVCEGFACSIASVIFMAGSKRVMRPASMLMLHNASMFAQGTPADLRKAAQDLETITELSKTAYLMHATDELTPEKLTEVMDAETWVKPETAVEWGLATEIDDLEETDEPSQSVASAVMQQLMMPQRLAKIPNSQNMTKRQVRNLVARVSLTQEQIDEIVERCVEKISDTLVAPTQLEFDPQTANPAVTPISVRYAQMFKKLSKE